MKVIYWLPRPQAVEVFGDLDLNLRYIVFLNLTPLGSEAKSIVFYLENPIVLVFLASDLSSIRIDVLTPE